MSMDVALDPSDRQKSWSCLAPNTGLTCSMYLLRAFISSGEKRTPAAPVDLYVFPSVTRRHRLAVFHYFPFVNVHQGNAFVNSSSLYIGNACMKKNIVSVITS